MGFDPCNSPLNIQKSIWDSNSQNRNSLGSVKVHSVIFFAILGFLLAYNLASPCFGREPKARVAPLLKYSLVIYIFITCVSF
jgi:hypothetical protein